MKREAGIDSESMVITLLSLFTSMLYLLPLSMHAFFFKIRKFPSYHPQYKVNVWPVRCTQVIGFHHLQIYSGYRGEIQYFHLKSRK